MSALLCMLSMYRHTCFWQVSLGYARICHAHESCLATMVHNMKYVASFEAQAFCRTKKEHFAFTYSKT